MRRFVMGIDQSTQGTKVVVLDQNGEMTAYKYIAHEQIISKEGWISHDLEKIYENIRMIIPLLLEENQITSEEIAALGICNQRETVAVWERDTGKLLSYAVVWQCSRGTDIAKRYEGTSFEALVKEKTGMELSPYFPAVKIKWMLENIEELETKAHAQEVCFGTVDTYLLFRLTQGEVFATDYSNASRTQLFNIEEMCWDKEICDELGIDRSCLPQVMDSDAMFGTTTLQGFFSQPVRIHCILGDSHAALFGQGCVHPGMIKATYGTGSSIMMNIGNRLRKNHAGLTVSIGWKAKGEVQYVLEGNIIYAGAVITWLKEKLGMIENAQETEELARMANEEDTTYLFPAFSGAGAPYWRNDMRACMSGMSRLTGRNEIVKAALESIAYQIADVIFAMEQVYGETIGQVCVDGGPVKNKYLMQFQSDILQKPLSIPQRAELSAIGAAKMAGLAAGIYAQDTEKHLKRTEIFPQMTIEKRKEKYEGWKSVLSMLHIDTAFNDRGFLNFSENDRW